MDDVTLVEKVATFPPVWVEAFRALKIDLSTETGRARLPGLKKLPLMGMLPTRVRARPICARIDTLTPLAVTTSLTEIDLCEAPFSDLSPLQGLTSLRRLVIWKSRVASLEPLAALSKLRTLMVWCTEVSDLAPLSGLRALEELNVEYTHVTDLAPLARLRKLRTLNVSGTGVVSLTPLREVPIEHLIACRTKIDDAALDQFRAEHPGCTIEHGDAWPDRATRCGC